MLTSRMILFSLATLAVLVHVVVSAIDQVKKEIDGLDCICQPKDNRTTDSTAEESHEMTALPYMLDKTTTLQSTETTTDESIERKCTPAELKQMKQSCVKGKCVSIDQGSNEKRKLKCNCTGTGYYGDRCQKEARASSVGDKRTDWKRSEHLWKIFVGTASALIICFLSVCILLKKVHSLKREIKVRDNRGAYHIPMQQRHPDRQQLV